MYSVCVKHDKVICACVQTRARACADMTGLSVDVSFKEIAVHVLAY